MTKNERADYIYSRANTLATSGRYRYPGAIVASLVSEGYPESASMFDTKLIQADLEMLCSGSSSSDILALLCGRGVRHG